MERHNWQTHFGTGLIPLLVWICIVKLNTHMFLFQTDTLCFYKAMRSQVESFLRDHLVIGKQVLGRKWNATIDQIHCQKRRLLIQLQYFFPQVTDLQENISWSSTYLYWTNLYWITKHRGTVNKVYWKWCLIISKNPNF